MSQANKAMIQVDLSLERVEGGVGKAQKERTYTCNDTSSDDGLSVGRKAADQGARSEEDIGKQEAVTAGEDIGQFARERLARRIGDQISRRQPRQKTQGVEG
jgi:hypothetical protein